MIFETWKDDYGLVYEPNYCKGTEADCRAAFQAGAACRDAEVAGINQRLDLLSEASLNITKERDKLREQTTLYEKALSASWPDGAMGDAFDFWNAARKLAATEPK